jgi:16S rRNA (guanine527-N7)-methyltransferase
MVVEKNDLSANLRAAIERAAGKIGLEVHEDNLKKMTIYADELQKWNKAYNLVGRKIGLEGLVELYVDAITPLTLRGMFDAGKEVLDIGSGAGLPGIPLYLLAGPFPLVLVESQRKKITFLRHVCRVLDLEDIHVYPGRLEDIARDEDHLNAYEVGLARAVMDPLRLSRLAHPLLCEGGKIIIFVGKGDAERIRRTSLQIEERGMKLESLKSTQRIVGRENYLAVFRKTGR